MANEVTTTQGPRLPLPPGVDAGKWRVLTEAIFPAARSASAILLALDYCRERGLDVLKKPVNIVPRWNSELGRYVESIWPSINEIETTAARTKEWAGMDEPKWGALITETFEGSRKTKKGWEKAKIEVTFPEWCAVTVYRVVGGVRCPFTEPVYWREAYGRVGGTALPNEMWTKRPHGQLHKVAKAASLRAAFPEEGEGPTDAEMEGQTIEHTEAPPTAPAPADNWQPPEQPPAEQAGGETFDSETGEVIEEPADPHALAIEPDEEWRSWCERLIVKVRTAKTVDEADRWTKANEVTLSRVAENAPKIHTLFLAAVGRHKVELVEAAGQQRLADAAQEEEPPQKTAAGDNPPGADQEEDSVARAYRQGDEARKAGKNRLAKPPEYLAADKKREAAAWSAGFNGAAIPTWVDQRK